MITAKCVLRCLKEGSIAPDFNSWLSQKKEKSYEDSIWNLTPCEC